MFHITKAAPVAKTIFSGNGKEKEITFFRKEKKYSRNNNVKPPRNIKRIVRVGSMAAFETRRGNTNTNTTIQLIMPVRPGEAGDISFFVGLVTGAVIDFLPGDPGGLRFDM